MKRAIMDKIRVLQFIHSSGVTGPGRIVYGLADNLKRDEFSCDVVCPDRGPLADDLRTLGTRIIPFKPEELKSLRGIINLAGILKNGNYHILHIHSGQYSALWKLLGRITGVPAIIYTEHVEGADHAWIQGRFAKRLHLLSHPVSNMMVDKVIAVSNQTRGVFIERQGMPPEKTAVVYNGVYTGILKGGAVDSGAIRKKFGVPSDAVLIGTVARLVPDKGHRFLVLAAREIVKERHDVRFIIVGEGPERGNIELLIEHNGLKDYFTITGFRPDAYRIMDCMDIIAQPSVKSSESFGLTVVEAMAKAKPVVASDIGCFREIIEDGVDGLLFISENPESLKDKIMLLLKDKDLRAKVGEAAGYKARSNFDITITAEKTGNLYREVLAAKGFVINKNAIGVIGRFLEAIKIEKGSSGERLDLCRDSIARYIAFTGHKELNAREIDEYLEREDNFIIESFLGFLCRTGTRCDDIKEHNNELFREVLNRKPVTARDYDERIRAQTLEFQIDNYYEPKDNSLKRRIDAVLAFLKPSAGETILDVGCGVGTFAYRSAVSGAKAYGADYSGESIEVANKLAHHFGYGGKIEYRCCDVCSRLPYPDGFFDKIVAADFIEHIDNAQKTALVSEMSRVLKDSGEIIIFTPNGIREKLGSLKSAVMKILRRVPNRTRLHYGLIDRFTFEKTLKAKGLKFKRNFIDVGRPYLAGIPVIREALSLDILWVIKK